MIDDQGQTVCDVCNHYIKISDWPFCPHERSGMATFRDDIPGGLTVENYGPTPMTFYSHSERRRYMEAHGLQEREKFSPFPGTDKDPAGIPNPAGYMDPYTLESARALICRVSTPNHKGTMEISSPFTLTLTGRDASAVVQGEAHRSSRVGRRVKHAQAR